MEHIAYYLKITSLNFLGGVLLLIILLKLTLIVAPKQGLALLPLFFQNLDLVQIFKPHLCSHVFQRKFSIPTQEINFIWFGTNVMDPSLCQYLHYVEKGAAVLASEM